MELPFKDNIYGNLFGSWLGWAMLPPSQKPQLHPEETPRGMDTPTTGGPGETQGERRGWRWGGAKRLPGWGVVRLVGIYAVGVGPRLAGTKPHGKLAIAVKAERSQQGPQSTSLRAFWRRRVS